MRKRYQIKNYFYLFWIRYPLLVIGIFTGIVAGILLKTGVIYSSPPPSKVIFKVAEVRRHSTPFKSCLLYRGTVNGVPCSIYHPHSKKRPLAHQHYELKGGELVQNGPYHYIYRGNKATTWTPIEGTSSLAEWRFGLKERVRKFVKERYSDKSVFYLVSALLTGNMESRFLKFQFGKVGLQHLLAISGFHFALLAMLLGVILKPLLPLRIRCVMLIILLSAYFLYMGGAPSISRAWIGVLIYLIGVLFYYRPTALSALGCAAISAIIFNPLVLTQVGFQLSFGATLGILLYYRPIERGLRRLLPSRRLKELTELSLLEKHMVFITTYIRKVSALSAAVLLYTLPLLLYHFHTFPLLSILYNSFFPLAFSLLILTLLTPLTAPLASALISLIECAPMRYNFSLTLAHFPTPALLSLLALISLSGAALHIKSLDFPHPIPL